MGFTNPAGTEDSITVELNARKAELEQKADALRAQQNELARLAREVEKAESRVIDRLAGVGQVLADAMAALRERPADTAAALHPEAPSGDDADSPTAKVYFVEFPAAAPPAETPPVAPAPAGAVDPEPEAGSKWNP